MHNGANFESAVMREPLSPIRIMRITTGAVARIPTVMVPNTSKWSLAAQLRPAARLRNLSIARLVAPTPCFSVSNGI